MDGRLLVALMCRHNVIDVVFFQIVIDYKDYRPFTILSGFIQ